MTPASWFAVLILAAAAALIATGAVTAWATTNAAKRVVGGVVALIGAALALGALGAPMFALAAIAFAFAHLTLGMGLVVRLQEAYGGVETAEVDAADRAAEAEEREA